jgi:hypothetical protein
MATHEAAGRDANRIDDGDEVIERRGRAAGAGRAGSRSDAACEQQQSIRTRIVATTSATMTPGCVPNDRSATGMHDGVECAWRGQLWLCTGQPPTGRIDAARSMVRSSRPRPDVRMRPSPVRLTDACYRAWCGDGVRARVASLLACVRACRAVAAALTGRIGRRRAVKSNSQRRGSSPLHNRLAADYYGDNQQKNIIDTQQYAQHAAKRSDTPMVDAHHQRRRLNLRLNFKFLFAFEVCRVLACG